MRCVSAADAAQMALVHSGRDELRERFLFQRGGVAIAEPLRRCECRYERFGRDQVADAERRKNCTRKRSEVDDASFGIQALQRFERLSLVAEFAIVIVLHHDRVFASGPIEQREARASGRIAPVGNWCEGVTKAMRAFFGSLAGFKPSRSTGTGCRRAPAARNISLVPWYCGSSMATGSPRSIKTRATRSSACCEPLTMITCDGSQMTARERRTWIAMASRNARLPAAVP